MSREDRIKVDEYAKAILDGDKSAIDSIYKLCQQRLCYIGHRYHENKEDIEEIVDDVFELFTKKLPYFMFVKGCYNWLVRATIKKILAFRKKLGRRKEIMKTVPIASFVKFDENKAHLFIEISKLTPPQLQQLTFYRYYCKMKIYELEIMFNLSRASVNRELKIAKSILKEKLK